jgi:hypothetical protein
MTTYLGIVDEVRTALSGPKAFLRPVFKVETEKSKWEEVEPDEFPNRGLASWWRPPASVLKGSAWLFRVHESETFEHENQYHCFFNVSEPADPTTELIEADGIQAEEDLRRELCFIGLAASSPLTSRVVIRFGGDRLLGPVHGIFRDGRLYLPDEALNSRLTIARAGPPESLAKYDGHYFLPLGDWSEKIGEVDFSPDSVFLKRALKELRSKDLASMKLTDNLMRQLVGGSADASLTVLEKQRLERLKNWTARVEENVTLTEEVVGEILELPAIHKEITHALEAAKVSAREAIEHELADEVKKIAAARAQLATLAAELAEGRHRQELFANALETMIEARIRSAMAKPEEFLADNALIRAALSCGTASATAKPERVPPAFTHFENLIGDREEIIGLLTTSFCRRGFRERLPLMLHATLLAGNVPLIYGIHAREVLQLYGSVVTSGNILWVPISPSQLEPADLLMSRTGGTQSCIPNANGLLDLLKRAQSSNAMYLVVCEGVNRCLMQSAIHPILRHVAERRQGIPGEPLITLPHPQDGSTVGIGIEWPRNVLLTGTLVDEPSLYPLDPSIWEDANWVFTDPYYDSKQRDLDDTSSVPTEAAGADFSAWSTWEPQAKQSPIGALKILLKLAGEKLVLDGKFFSSTSRLHTILSRQDSSVKLPDVLSCLVELTLLPRCTKQMSRLKEILEGPPFELWQDIKGAEVLHRLTATSGADAPDKETW